jgi:hypothetical protein
MKWICNTHGRYQLCLEVCNGTSPIDRVAEVVFRPPTRNNASAMKGQQQQQQCVSFDEAGWLQSLRDESNPARAWWWQRCTQLGQFHGGSSVDPNNVFFDIDVNTVRRPCVRARRSTYACTTRHRPSRGWKCSRHRCCDKSSRQETAGSMFNPFAVCCACCGLLLLWARRARARVRTQVVGYCGKIFPNTRAAAGPDTDRFNKVPECVDARLLTFVGDGEMHLVRIHDVYVVQVLQHALWRRPSSSREHHRATPDRTRVARARTMTMTMVVIMMTMQFYNIFCGPRWLL